MLKHLLILLTLLSTLLVTAQGNPIYDDYEYNENAQKVRVKTPQNFIQLTNRTTKDSVKIYEGTKVIILTVDSKTIKGKLAVVNDSIIMVDDIIFLHLNQIKELQVKSTKSERVVLGTSGILISGGIITLAIAANAWDIEGLIVYGALGVVATIAGIGVGVASLIMLSIRPKYSIEDWEFKNVIVPLNSTP